MGSVAGVYIYNAWLCFVWYHFLDDSQSVPPSSLACKEVVISIICLFVFPICDGEDGLKYIPSQELCENISTGACEKEWAIVANLREIILPSCGDLPDGMFFVIVSHSETAQSMTNCLLISSFILTLHLSVYHTID